MAMTKRDKRGLLISLCIIAAVAYVFPMLVMAEPSEHNFKIKQDDWNYSYRNREGTWGTEIGRNVGPVNLTYRYAKLRNTRENRIKLTHKLFAYEDLTVKHRIEYRSLETKTSHWRYRLIFQYTPHIYGPIHLYVKVQPRWAFINGRTVVDHRDQLGLTWKEDNWKFTPFVERYALDGFDYKTTVYGTHFEYKL